MIICGYLWSAHYGLASRDCMINLFSWVRTLRILGIRYPALVPAISTVVVKDCLRCSITIFFFTVRLIFRILYFSLERYWVTQKYAQICTVIHLHMYCEGCVIFCGYLWGAEYVKESLITVSFRNCNL